MSIQNEEYLKSINDFAILGLKFLYISNAGAIIAILANLHNLIDKANYSSVSCALTMFVLGIIFSFVANFSGYFMYRSILIARLQARTSKGEIVSVVIGIGTAILSAFFFGFGAFKAISMIG